MNIVKVGARTDDRRGPLIARSQIRLWPLVLLAADRESLVSLMGSTFQATRSRYKNNLITFNNYCI